VKKTSRSFRSDHARRGRILVGGAGVGAREKSGSISVATER
jgi:hypothetical protein